MEFRRVLFRSKELARFCSFDRIDAGAEADRLVFHAGCNDTLEPGEGAAADEENILGVNLDEFLLRIFEAALRCDIRNRSFDEFQKRLLNAFAGNIASDRGAVAIQRDLIDLDDRDGALLRSFDVARKSVQ